jgi:hypothetical protein
MCFHRMYIPAYSYPSSLTFRDSAVGILCVDLFSLADPCWLCPPTSGTIIIHGKNLQTDLSGVRVKLGMCPQQDVLLENLTVWEHLLLFASIRMPWRTKKELQQQVNKLVNSYLFIFLDFACCVSKDHRNTFKSSLSIFMRRKSKCFPTRDLWHSQQHWDIRRFSEETLGLIWFVFEVGKSWANMGKCAAAAGGRFVCWEQRVP